MNSTVSGNFNAGAGQSWSFNQVVAELNRVLKTDLQPDYFDNPYGFTQDWTQTDQTLARAFALRSVGIDVAGRKRDKDLATASRPGEQDVEAPLAALQRYRAERHAIETRAR